MNVPDDSSQNPAQIPGARVGAGRFVLDEMLGQGGMGMVWLARDERLGELVALKFLPPQIRFDAAALASLRRETQRSHSLSHPNIIRIHDLHEPQGEAPFIAMEYVDGPTLNALRLEQPGEVFAWDKLAPLVRQLCGALDYAHGEKIIHRDLKPGNLMIDSKDRLRLADFGISTVLSDSKARVSLVPGSGSPAYMSPQQINGERPQPTDDIYSLGAALYELLTGAPPFFSGEIIHQVLHNPAPPLPQRLAELGLTNDVPADVEALIMACLAKDASQRPQSARAVADWIGWEQTPHPASLAATVSAPDKEGTEGKMNAVTARLVSLAAVIVLCAGLLLGGWFWTKREGSKQAAADIASAPLEKSAQPEPVVFAEDFEAKAGTDGKSQWKWWEGSDPQATHKWLAENGNHFVRLEGKDWNKKAGLDAVLPIQPEWKKLRFSYRIRAQGINANPADGNSGGDLFSRFGSEKKWLLPGSGTPLLRLRKNTDWITRSVAVDVPASAEYVDLGLSLEHVSGLVDFDDIRVTVSETNSPLAVRR